MMLLEEVILKISYFSAAKFEYGKIATDYTDN
jgi:hypothetical protein